MAEEKYTCSVCGQEFGDIDSLKDHMATNHATKTEIIGEGETK